MYSAVIHAFVLTGSLFHSELDAGLVDNPYSLDSKRACGAYCVGFVDRYLGGTRTYHEIVTICPPGAGGLSFEEIEIALRKLGYHTRGVTLNSDAIQRLRWPCIVHEKTEQSNGHFLVCVRWRDESRTFQVFDPPRQLGELNSEELDRRIGKTVLVVSKEPLPPAEDLIPSPFSWQFYAGLWLIGFGAIWISSDWIRSIRTGRQKITAVALIVGLFQAGCGRSAPSPAVTDAVVPDANGELIVDAGDIHQGTDLKATFQVKNRSGTAFRVHNVERSCRCQNVKFDAERTVAPGEETPIQVTIATKEYAGPMIQRLIVKAVTNSGAEQSIPLAVKANVLTTIRAIPSQVMFGAIASASTRRFRILTNPPDLAERFMSINAPDFLEAKLVERKRGELVFDLSVLDNLPSGSFNAQVKLCFDHRDTPEFQVMAMGKKTGPVDVIPSRIVVNRRRVEQSVKIRIASTNQTRFRVLASQSPAGVTPLILDENESKTQFMIDVLITSPELLEGKFITLKTDLSDAPEVRIPLTVTN